MKKLLYFSFLLSIITYSNLLFGQTTQQTGPWEDNETWIEDAPGYTFGNNVILTINLNHEVETAEEVVITFQNNATVNVYGTLIINGNINVMNNLSLNVFEDGILIINGNLDLNNNGSLDVNGTLDVDTISGDNNNSVTGDGTINVDYIDGVDTDDFDGVINTDPMPVELLYFNLAQFEDVVIIEWATASEINNDFFTIERSIDGINWDVIKNVKGYGNSNQFISYETKDEYPLEGVSYYRLKQTDFDGKFEYYSPKSFEYFSNFKENKIVSFNVNNNIIHIWLFNRSNDSKLILADIYGKLISYQVIQPSDYIQKISLNLTRSYSGEIVVIRLDSNAKSDFKKVLVK
jgi:hypothetical protein